MHHELWGTQTKQSMASQFFEPVFSINYEQFPFK
jgi:hypothetical protein